MADCPLCVLFHDGPVQNSASLKKELAISAVDVLLESLSKQLNLSMQELRIAVIHSLSADSCEYTQQEQHKAELH